MGILNPNSGVPLCNTAPSTPPDQFAWQDLVQMKYRLEEEFANRGTFLMNFRTLGLVLSMSDAVGRPIWMQFPSEDGRIGGGFQIAGSPVRVVAWMPDVVAGATPIAFGDWERAYMIVRRAPVIFQTDPYSLGWCTQFRAETRIGGAVVCQAAAVLLRVQ
jgi:HK97 family phage major capsid protein